jgi:short-subunit dehydrogenase
MVSPMHQTSRTALITDATAGLGREFATQLARRGYNLVLVAGSASRLESITTALRADHGVRTRGVAVDLGEHDAIKKIGDGVAALGNPIDVLVSDPGFAPAGRFSSTPSSPGNDRLMINLTKLVDLSRGVAARMADRHGGAVINVGPVFRTQAPNSSATYSAANTFILNFSLALHTDFHGQGVRVAALAPWPVDSAFLDVVGTQPGFGGRVLTPRSVVRSALRTVACDQPRETPSLAARVSERLAPRAELLLPAI